MTVTAGYDIGGAHLKVALADGSTIVHAEQIPCPLWRGLDQLDAAFAQAAAMTARAERHAVTMTGELADVFPDRYTGVASILERVQAVLGSGVGVWMGSGGLGTPAAALRRHLDVASTNFLATATVAASKVHDGLLIDMGSTTTDIVLLADGRACAHGLTDGERMRTGELVYTGLTRTPVMGVTTRAKFKGQQQGMARDPFATMADVRRVTGELPDGVDQHGTADGRGKSVAESRARLARCFGRDADEGEEADWVLAAREIAAAQGASIADGCRDVLARSGSGKPLRVVVAGIGADVSGRIATELTMPFMTFGQLIGAPLEWRDWATRCAPAAALALIAGA